MISFRYHIVSIVSVFLALAIGVALGGGPLKGEVDNTLVDQVKADRKTKVDLQAQITALKAASGFNDEFARHRRADPGASALAARATSLTWSCCPPRSRPT